MRKQLFRFRKPRSSSPAEQLLLKEDPTLDVRVFERSVAIFGSFIHKKGIMQTRNSFHNMKWIWTATECVCETAHISTTTLIKFRPPEHMMSLKTNRFSAARTENTVQNMPVHISWGGPVIPFGTTSRLLMWSSSGAADITCGTKKNCCQHLENSEARRKQLCSNDFNFHLTFSSRAYT